MTLSNLISLLLVLGAAFALIRARKIVRKQLEDEKRPRYDLGEPTDTYKCCGLGVLGARLVSTRSSPETHPSYRDLPRPLVKAGPGDYVGERRREAR